MLEDIRHSIRIHAPRERVWRAMTGGGLVEQWLGCIGFSPETGTIFYMQPDPAKRAAGDITGATHCELVVLEEPSRMRFSWFLPGTPKTHVQIELHEVDARITVATLVHSGWGQFDAGQIAAVHDALASGWRSHVLPGLARVAESGAADELGRACRAG